MSIKRRWLEHFRMSAEDALALLAAAEDVLAGSETRMVRYAGGRVRLTQTAEGSQVGAQRSPGGKWRCATIYTEELAWLVKAPRAGVGSAPAKRREAWARRGLVPPGADAGAGRQPATLKLAVPLARPYAHDT